MTKTKLERASALTALKQRNEQNFKSLGLLSPRFTIKFAYTPKHREDLVVSMFPSEMEFKEDVYLELTDGENYPIHEEPVLYKMRHNPHYKQEYEVIPADPARNKISETYLIPVAELEIVAGSKTNDLKIVEKPVISTASIEKTTSVEKEDAHYSEITIRDIAAIFLKVPVSNKKWLNNLINSVK